MISYCSLALAVDETHMTAGFRILLWEFGGPKHEGYVPLPKNATLPF